MDPNEWYPIGIKDGSKVSTLAGQTKPYGLHITATKKISVYVIVRAEASMDASNILPVTAIGSEYYVQDYVPEAHNDESAWSLLLKTAQGWSLIPPIHLLAKRMQIRSL